MKPIPFAAATCLCIASGVLWQTHFAATAIYCGLMVFVWCANDVCAALRERRP